MRSIVNIPEEVPSAVIPSTWRQQRLQQLLKKHPQMETPRSSSPKHRLVFATLVALPIEEVAGGMLQCWLQQLRLQEVMTEQQSGDD